MIDAYDIQQKVREYWGLLCRMHSGDSVKKVYPRVPVYVIVDGKKSEVKEVYVDNKQIILRADNEQSTV